MTGHSDNVTAHSDNRSKSVTIKSESAVTIAESLVTLFRNQRSRWVGIRNQGVYILAERGERRPDGRQKLIAYAMGCNPAVDAFDDWWELARTEFGGDDFGEFFDPHDGVFALILSGESDLEVSAMATHLSLRAVAPTRNGI